MPELAGGEEVDNPFLELIDSDVETGGDYATLVQAAGQLDNNLSGAVIVDDFKLSDVS